MKQMCEHVHHVLKEGGCIWNVKDSPCFGSSKKEKIGQPKKETGKHVVSISKEDSFFLYYFNSQDGVFSFVKNLPVTLCFKHLVLFKTSNCW